jgi:magnesium transporter
VKALKAADCAAAELKSLVADPAQSFWLDIDSAEPAQHALLAEVFAFHPLAIEDTLNPHTRVKIEEYEGYLFIVLRAMRFDSERPLDSHELRVKKLCLFLGPNYLVSVHAGPSSSLARAEALLDRDGAILAQGDPARIAHVIADAVIDAYFPVIDRVDEFVDRFERSGLHELDRAAFEEVLRVRRLAFAARRSLSPQQEILDALAHKPHRLVPQDAQFYFRDVYDHALRITDSLDAYHEIIANTTDNYIAQLSMRLNYATSIFSAIATVAIPFLIISGLWGMNFTREPLVNNPYGFWIAIGIQIAISVVLLAILRLRRLL